VAALCAVSQGAIHDAACEAFLRRAHSVNPQPGIALRFAAQESATPKLPEEWNWPRDYDPHTTDAHSGH
jgi:hypothetical protein